jgi:D-3-phosphoglycerate dehydrogenase / 2-oxoglutarate reductase
VRRILLTNPVHADVHAGLAAIAEVAVAPDTGAATLRAMASAANLIIVRAPLPDDIFERAHDMLAAIRHGAGVDMIPIGEATARGVLVANVPGVNARSVAEYVVAAMIGLSRRLRSIDQALRGDGGWAGARAWADHGVELADKTIGIVGFGNVGRALAAICRDGFGMRILAANRSPIAAMAGVVQVALADLLADSDYVVLACPLNDQTRGMIGSAELARMKRTAYLINVARGAVVEEPALLEALANRGIAGAALDVFWHQPLPAAHPLFEFDNLLLTPHLAGITDESMQRMGRGCIDAARRVFDGERPAHLLNPQAWPSFQARYTARKQGGD